jgi:hypothetical protein
LNLGKSSSTNIEIFQQAINAVAAHNCKYLFVAWTEIFRYKFSLGVELYNVDQYWSPKTSTISVNLNCITYSEKYLNNIKNRFFALHHEHNEIIKLLNYTATINRVCQRLGVKVYFVNSILPWDHKYFNHVVVNNRKPSDTTIYTQMLLNSETRSDQEFFKIYDRVHQEYQCTGGTTECNWLNLDSGFNKNFRLDYGNDNQHPGIMSHTQFGNHLIQSFEQITEKA